MHASVQDELQRLRAYANDLTGTRRANEELLQDLSGLPVEVERWHVTSQQLRRELATCREVSRLLQEVVNRLRPKANKVDSLREEHDVLWNELKAPWASLFVEKCSIEPSSQVAVLCAACRQSKMRYATMRVFSCTMQHAGEVICSMPSYRLEASPCAACQPNMESYSHPAFHCAAFQH